MSRRFVFLGTGGLLLAALLALGTTATQWRTADALSNCSTGTPGMSGTEQQLMALINNHRAQHGLGSLRASPNLFRAAAWMSEDLTASGAFSHTDSLGRSAFARVGQCGYGSSGAGENIAMTSSAASAFNLFLNSAGHNANMLNPSWQVIGVGQTGRIWVVDFGMSDDSGEPWDSGSPPPPPPPTRTATQAPPHPNPQPTATPQAGGSPAQPGGTNGNGAESAAPAAVKTTILPPTNFKLWELPSNAPVRRAMLQMIATE